jgi:hypothetical protein
MASAAAHLLLKISFYPVDPVKKVSLNGTVSFSSLPTPLKFPKKLKFRDPHP